MRDPFVFNLINILRQQTLGLGQDLNDLNTSDKTNIINAIKSIVDGNSKFLGITSYDSSVNLSNILDSDYNLINVGTVKNLVNSATESTINFIHQRNVVTIDFSVAYIYTEGAGTPVFNNGTPAIDELILNTTDNKIYFYDSIRDEWHVAADLESLTNDEYDVVVIHDVNGSVSENNNIKDNIIRIFTSDKNWHLVTPSPFVIFMVNPNSGANGWLSGGSVFGTSPSVTSSFYFYDKDNDVFVKFQLEEVENLRLLTGTNAFSFNLGTFDGNIISDNTTIKNALQELETAIENVQSNTDSAAKYSDFTDSSTISFTANSNDIHADIIDGSIKDQHIASDAAISADKLTSGTTNVIITNSEKSNYDTAYDHSQITSGNPHNVSLEMARLVSNAFAGNISMGGFLITNLGTPVNGTDAVNKDYVDNISAGLDPKASVTVATTENLDATYDSANMTLTMNSTGALSIDGVSLSVGNRVLVKNQIDAKQNGIYVVSVVGDDTTSAVLTRASDFDGSPSNEVSGGNYTFVDVGNTNAGAGFVVLGKGELTIDTDDIVWTQFSGAGQITAGVGLTKNGNVISVLLGAGIGELPTGEVGIDIRPNSGLILTIDGVTSSTDTAAQLAINPTIAGEALSYTAGILDVLYDDTTIGLNGDGKLEVKDSSINADKLDTGLNSGQVNASVIPFDKSNSFLTSDQVNAVIKEVFDFVFEFSAMSIDKEYDANGLLTKETIKNSAGNILYTVEYAYKDVNGIQMEDTITKKVYDGSLSDVSSATPVKTVTDTYTYDANGNVTNISRTIS